MSDAPPLLRFGSERVARYDHAIEVPLVLADAFASQTRRVLGESDRALAAVGSELLAAAGDARRSLRGELHDLEPRGGPGRRAVEQAREWRRHA